MKREIWKDIPGFEGMYKVSSLGRVVSLKRGTRTKDKILKPLINGHGYLHVAIKGKMCRINQLVAMAFLNHIPDSKRIVVDHINNIRTDNRLCNLQVITRRENCSKDKKNKTSKYTGVSWKKREKRWYACITVNNKTEYIGIFKDELEASKAYQKRLKEITNTMPKAK